MLNNRMWLLALLCAIIGLPATAMATDQGAVWVPTNGPYGGPVIGLVSDSSGNLFAGTGVGVYRSMDHAATWEWVSPLVPEPDAFIVDRAGAIVLGQSLVGGREGGVWKSTDAGESWLPVAFEGHQISALASNEENEVFFAVNDVQQKGVYKLGAGGESSYDGLSGKRIRLLLSTPAHGLLAIEWGSLYGRASENADWSLIGERESEILAVTEDTSGTLYVGLQEGRVERSTDGGATWDSAGSFDWNPVESLASLPTGEMYAGIRGFEPSLPGGIYVTTDRGQTWGSLGLKEWGINTLLPRDRDDIFLGTPRGVFSTTNGGASWEAACDGMAATTPRALLCVDESTLFAGTMAVLFRSTDGGESWHESGEGILPHWITSLGKGPDGTLFATNMVFSNGGGVYKSTDMGETWKWTTKELQISLYTDIPCAFVTRTGAVICGVLDSDWRIIRSDDGGLSWATVTTPAELFSAAEEPSGRLLGTSWRNGVLRSSDDGITWELADSGLHSLDLRCIATRDTGEVFVGGRGGVSRSTNCGDSWELITGALGDIYARAIAVDVQGDILVSTWDNRLFRSTDDGGSWTEDSVWSSGGGFTVFAGSDEGLFAADSIGRVFRCERSVTSVGTLGAALPSTVALQQNYPNPFNPSTTIEFLLPRSGFVVLGVYNVLGEEVATLVEGEQTAGTFKTTWDASGLPSGIYFYRLTAGKYVQTRKMVLMR